MGLSDIDISFHRLWLSAIIGGLVWLLGSSFQSWWRLRHVPGPWLAGISYLWLAMTSGSGRQWYVLRDLGSQYGPLVRVGPNYLTTDDPELLRRISSARDSYSRDRWYEGSRWNPFNDTGYAGRDTPSLERVIDNHVAALIASIRGRYLSHRGTVRHLDFARITSFFTLDVISAVAFGKPFGYLEADEDLYSFLSIVRANWPKISVSNDVPWVRSILYSPLFLRLLGPKYTNTTGLGRIMSISRDAVANRYLDDNKDQKDMMSSWMRHGMTQTESESEGLFMIIAGSDTVASVVRVTMLNILSNALVYRKLRQTIDASINSGAVSTPITNEEARQIPYLQALIYEGLRIRAPASGPFMKRVPAGGTVIHGMSIPGGTAIGMNISSLFRSKELFGDDANLFRPERFLEARDEQRTEMERNVDLAFGYGRWMCAGKPIAFMELNKLFFELLRAFDFQLLNPEKPWNSKSYMIFIEQDMWLRVTERSV